MMHPFGFGTSCYQGMDTLGHNSFARMTATKMAVDLRSLQLHAGRSSAPTVPRVPGTWTLPLYLCNSALCWLSAWLRVEVQQGLFIAQNAISIMHSWKCLFSNMILIYFCPVHEFIFKVAFCKIEKCIMCKINQLLNFCMEFCMD